MPRFRIAITLSLIVLSIACESKDPLANRTYPSKLPLKIVDIQSENHQSTDPNGNPPTLVVGKRTLPIRQLAPKYEVFLIPPSEFTRMPEAAGFSYEDDSYIAVREWPIDFDTFDRATRSDTMDPPDRIRVGQRTGYWYRWYSTDGNEYVQLWIDCDGATVEIIGSTNTYSVMEKIMESVGTTVIRKRRESGIG